MTQDEIKAMAKEAGMMVFEDGYVDCYFYDLERFAKLVAAHKCEELAKKIEAMPFRDTAASFAKWVREQA